MKTKKFVITTAWAVLCIALLALSGCADSVSFLKAATMEPVGFWHGLWHGMILPFAWLVSLFNSDVAIYATYNNGGWYNLGFVLGVGALGRRVKARRGKSETDQANRPHSHS